MKTNQNSLLERLYDAYSENHPIADQNTRRLFHSLDNYLSSLSLNEIDRVFDLVCQLCIAHEQLAFRRGLEVGAKLILELNNGFQSSTPN